MGRKHVPRHAALKPRRRPQLRLLQDVLLADLLVHEYVADELHGRARGHVARRRRGRARAGAAAARLARAESARVTPAVAANRARAVGRAGGGREQSRYSLGGAHWSCHPI